MEIKKEVLYECQPMTILNLDKCPDTIFYPKHETTDPDSYIRRHTESWTGVVNGDTVLIESICNCIEK